MTLTSFWLHELVGQRFQLVERSRREMKVAAFLGKAASETFADALRRSRDKYSSRQLQVQRFFLLEIP